MFGDYFVRLQPGIRAGDYIKIKEFGLKESKKQKSSENSSHSKDQTTSDEPIKSTVGHHYVLLKVQIPDSLSAEEKKLYKKLLSLDEPFSESDYEDEDPFSYDVDLRDSLDYQNFMHQFETARKRQKEEDCLITVQGKEYNKDSILYKFKKTITPSN